jgi:hypothetical protein
MRAAAVGAGTARRSAALLLVLTACSAPAPPAQDAHLTRDDRLPTAMVMIEGDSQLVPAAGRADARPTVVLHDAHGRPVAGVPVAFMAADGGWVADAHVVTGDDGLAATTWYVGPRAGAAYRLTATAGALQAEFTARTTTPSPGTSYFGSDGYVEYVPGDLPIIISVPHGGSLTPDALPDRAGAVITVGDAHTEELAREIADAFMRRTGSRPTLVISRLHRRKLDPNRAVDEAAQDAPPAMLAWREYHAFIEAARASLVHAGVPGVYIDLHGHGHDAQRLELGYLLSGRDLALSEATLNSPAYTARSSLRALLERTPGTSHADLLRGPFSLGSLFERHGYPAVPSASLPDPGLAPFYSGGYSVARHASRDGALIAGVQIEVNRTGARDSPANRRAFAAAFAAVLLEFSARWLDQGMSRAVVGGR